MTIPERLELKAREIVLEAMALGGKLWQHATPATIELLIEAVALDLRERERMPSAPTHDLTDDPSVI